MIRHLFKLVWNRKRTNVLIILEIFFSFLVVFLVSTLGIFVCTEQAVALILVAASDDAFAVLVMGVADHPA